MAVFVVKAMEACPTLDPTDEMIRVAGVCIDKYEASLWDAPVGGNQITGTIPCSTFGNDISCVGLGEGEANSHRPGALIRGGDFSFGADAGPFAVSGDTQPSLAHSRLGLRGAR